MRKARRLLRTPAGLVALSVSAISLLWVQPAAFATRPVTRVQTAARVPASPSTRGSELWATRFNGPANGEDLATALGVSADGSRVFVTGRSAGSTSGDDYATRAYDASTGARLWAKRYNGPGNGEDGAAAMGVSPDGSKVFVTGSSYGSTSAYDYATVAYDASTGARLWLARYNGPASRNDHATALGVSPDGSTVFVTGYSAKSTNIYDYATVAYDASTGAKLWVTRYNGPANGEDTANALGVSPDGSRVFVTGSSYGSTSDYDFATAAYNASTGAKLWVKRYNDPANIDDGATALGTSPDGSTVFVTGGTGLGSNFDYITVAYEASTGAKLWVKRYNGPGNDDDLATALGVSPDGSTVFVTGRSTGSGSGYDYATIAYDASTGARLWIESYNGPGNGHDYTTALGVSPDGSRVFVTGPSYGSTSDFDYATVAYNASNGAKLWVTRYNGSANGDDIANALGVSPDGSRVFVTGSSVRSAGNDDYATVAYAAV